MSTATASTTTRDATTDDLPALADMGVRFEAETPFASLGATRDAIAAGMMRVLDSGGFVRLLEHDGKPVGMLIGCLSPRWSDPTCVMAVELAWWVEPGCSGGLRLLRDFEAWARQHRARLVTGSDLLGSTAESPAARTSRAERIYEATHYRAVERVWIKELP